MQITASPQRSVSPKLVLLGLVLMSLWPLYAALARFVPTTHADENHCCEKYPPKVIRACIANMVASGLAPAQYENIGEGKIAVVCKLDTNRFGVQINRVVQLANGEVELHEITTFYSTFNRVMNILTRDKYIAVQPLQ